MAVEGSGIRTVALRHQGRGVHRASPYFPRPASAEPASPGRRTAGRPARVGAPCSRSGWVPRPCKMIAAPGPAGAPGGVRRVRSRRPSAVREAGTPRRLRQKNESPGAVHGPARMPTPGRGQQQTACSKITVATDSLDRILLSFMDFVGMRLQCKGAFQHGPASTCCCCRFPTLWLSTT